MADRSSGLPRPAPGVSGQKTHPMPMKTADWPKAPGPKGPRFNKIGFKEIKEHAAQDMGDDGAVSKKISKLVHEGTPQVQAVAEALSMKRAGRLTKSGGYIRAKK